VGVVAAIIAGAVPLVIVARLRRQRMLRFAEQLPEALDLIRSALQAGHGVPSAISVVADTFPDPIAYEFRYMVEEMRLGLSMREALQHLSERVEDPNLPILTVGILVATDSGGNLAEVVDNIAYTIRERFKLIRETRVLTAQGRLSGMVLTALPFLVGGLMFLWNPTYFNPLIQNRTGHYMIAYGLFSLAFGHWFIQRIVRIKV
jgi:tight adherence protein B